MNGIFNSDSVKKGLGTKIKEARGDMSRQSLADALNACEARPYEPKRKDGLTVDRLKQWELGNNPVDLEWLPAICKVLDVDYGYLFGEYSEKNRVISDVVKETGLTENAVNVLIQLSSKKQVRAYSDLLSCLISDPDFEYFLGLLEGFFSGDKEISAELSMSDFKCRQKDLSIFAASTSLQSIMNRIGPAFLSQYKTTGQRLEEYFEQVKRPTLERRMNNG
ncbi:MAG: helix-turn-helix transcriptional regulator [Oscillospiraceae bacterium]|nr:helix-turn-helix transcriptional regulator [Oscillospiraceae bacterium]